MHTKTPETRWSVVQSVATGDREACGAFSSVYLAVVRAFLRKRWHGTTAAGHVDDATQDVFVDIMRTDGALTRMDRSRTASFRSYLFGVVRNIAQRYEARDADQRERRRRLEARERSVRVSDSMSRVFDREWALRALSMARDRLEELAGDARQQRRVELLRLRYQDGLPIREIARRWHVDAAFLHHEHSKARQEFKQALRVVVAALGSRHDPEAECLQLLGMLA